MKKMKILALVAAVVLGIAVYRFLDILSQPQVIPTTAVAIAAADIPENTIIKAEMLTMKNIPTDAVLPNAVLNISDAVDMVMSSDVLAGEQIVTGRLVRMGDTTDKSTTLAYIVKPGMRAVTVNVSTTSGLMTMLKPGNRVDIIANYMIQTEKEFDEKGQEIPPKEENRTASKLFMQNLELLAVDSVRKKEGVDAETGYQTVTLSVTPEQAVEISFLEANTDLRLVLRSSLDQEQAAEALITTDILKVQEADK